MSSSEYFKMASTQALFMNECMYIHVLALENEVCELHTQVITWDYDRKTNGNLDDELNDWQFKLLPQLLNLVSDPCV